MSDTDPRLPRVGDQVWIDPGYCYEQASPVVVEAVEHEAALLPGYGWFDLHDLTVATP